MAEWQKMDKPPPGIQSLIEKFEAVKQVLEANRDALVAQRDAVITAKQHPGRHRGRGGSPRKRKG